MKRTVRDGIQLNVERSGRGIPCVYLHGGPGYWSKSFQEIAGTILEEHLNMIYLDQRGCGRSDPDPEEHYSLKKLVDDLEDIRQQLHIDEWVLMGHSFGGILAVNYADQYPEYTKGVILFNATLNMKDSLEYQIQKGLRTLQLPSVEIARDRIEELTALFNRTLEELRKRDLYDSFQFMNPDNKKIIDRIDQSLEMKSSFQQYVFSSEEYFKDFTPLTREIEKPVLVITGEHDHAIGPDHYRTFQFPHSQIMKINGAHHTYLENQRELEKGIENFVKTMM